MISLPAGSKIWLVARATDMRCGFHGLASKVQNVLDADPFSGHMFVFRGKSGVLLKVLWADRDGLCLFSKRVERERFAWPASRDGRRIMTIQVSGRLLPAYFHPRSATENNFHAAGILRHPQGLFPDNTALVANLRSWVLAREVIKSAPFTCSVRSLVHDAAGSPAVQAC